MAFSIPNMAFRQTSEEAGGQPDYQKALQDVFSNVQGAYKTAYTPQDMASELLKKQLANKFNKPYAENADQWFQADLGYKQALANQANRASQVPILSPYEKMRLSIQEATGKKEAEKNVVSNRATEESNPQSLQLVNEINSALPIITKHPEWFGAATPGLGAFTGPEARKRGINDPDYGKLESLFGRLTGPQAKELSGNRILASALQLAQSIKPGYGEKNLIASGKLQQIKDKLLKSMQEEQKRYSERGGKQDLEHYKYSDPSDFTKVTIHGKSKMVPNHRVYLYFNKPGVTIG